MGAESLVSLLLLARALLAPAAPGDVRIAPLVALETRSPGGLSLRDARLAERRDARGDITLEAFLFSVEKAPGGIARAEAELRLQLPDGRRQTLRAPIGPLAVGAEIRVPARLAVTGALEGESLVTLTLADPTRPTGTEAGPLFEGTFSFGYPRYDTSRGPTRLSTSATIRDDFEGPAIDNRLWRTWISDPSRARVRQEAGRLWIDAAGEVGYNGLVSLTEIPERDVEAVCRAGVVSTPQAKHAALVHLCGSGPLSPDHWLEVQLRDAGSGRGTATVNVALPPERRSGYRGGYELPAHASEGYTLRVVCEAATHVCRGFAFAPFSSGGGEWWQLGDGFEVPARTARLEIKTSGWAEPGASSRLWFDDCRVYPRPQTHYLTVVLRRADGRPPAGRPEGGGPPACFDPANRKAPDCDLSVRLYDAAGERIVDEAHTAAGFGFALLKLDRSGWDLYPVGATLRVLAGDRPIGPDHRIQAGAVQGLYPDDVYEIILD